MMSTKILLLLSCMCTNLMVYAQIYTPEIKVENTSGKIGLGEVPDSNGADLEIRANSLKIENALGSSHSYLPYYNGEIYLTGNKDAGGSGSLHFRTYSSSENYKDRMLINGDGKVGVGTISPSENISIYGSGGSDGQKIGIGPTSARKWQIEAAPFSNNRNIGHYPLIIRRQYSSNTVDGDFIIESDGNNFSIERNGRVGIGIPNPSEELHVNGDILATGHITSSDRKFKKNIKNYDAGLSLIKKIKPIKYQMATAPDTITTKDKKDIDHIGIVAQDIQAIAPDLVITYMDAEGEESLAVDYSSFTFILINAVKEQQAEIEALRREVQLLKLGKNK